MKKDDIKNNKYQDTFIKEDFNKKSEKVYKMNKSEFSKRRAMFEPLNKIQNIINNPQNQKNELNQNQDQKNNKLIQNQIQKKIKPFNNKEILAHINIGFEQIFGYRLRFTQLISLYILIHKKKNLGRIIQVLTGEGKTCIIIGLAIYHVLKNHKVDIVTSNEILAIRDSTLKKNVEIYKLFNIEVSHCISSKDRKKKCYDKSIDIVYGDTHNFQADFLHENYYSENIKNGRGEDIIIVDEIDSMLVDEYAKSTLLAGKKPYMESLNPILYFLYYYLKKLVGTKKQINTKEEHNKLSEILIDLGTKIINGYKENDKEILPIPLPPYLKEYALMELKTWANNAIIAFNSVEKESYIKENDKIIPVDNENTGVIQYQSSLSSGLHQFLEIKEQCPITPINIITNFQSNYGFFNLYKNEKRNNIYGLTGTLGSKISKTLLKDIYDLDFAFIPSFYERKLKQLCPRLESPENWINAIIETSLKAYRKNRVVLIVCKSIKIANKINDEFIHRNANLKIHMLTNAEQSKQLELYNNMKPCNIIIATNLAGRGTDINLSKEVIKNRGLHVCLTFIPRNERVEEQAFGRAGRKGEPGTYQLICNFFEEITNFTGILFTGNLPKQIQNIFLIQSDLDSKLGKILFPCFVIKEEDLDKNQNSDNNKKENIKNSIIKLNDFIKKELKDLPMNYEKLIKERDLKEEKELNKVNQEIDKIKLKDNLFNHYLKFIKEKNLKPNELIFKDIEEQWGLWLNKITNQEVKKDTDSVNEFNNWKKKYNNELYYENYGFLCQKIQNNFIDNKFIHNYSESITEELVTNISNWFRKKDNPEIKKIVDIKKELENSENKIKNYSSFILFYYLGIIQILLKEKEKGLASLNKAKELIVEEYTYLFNCYLNSNAYKKYNDQLLNMVTLLHSIEQFLIDDVIKFIKSNKNFQLKKSTLDIYFQEMDKYKDAFEELKFKGLYIIFIPESSSSGILSFVTKFFSKLIKNLKGVFGLKGSSDFRRNLLEKIKNNTHYNGKYKIENENENLNFLQKIKISFYDTLFEPNFQQNKLLDYTKIANKEKNPLFCQIMTTYEKQ